MPAIGCLMGVFWRQLIDYVLTGSYFCNIDNNNGEMSDVGGE